MKTFSTAIRTFLSRPFRHTGAKPSAKRSPIAAAAFETLEDRRLQSVTINGTAGPDTITVYPAANATFDITVNGIKKNTGSQLITDFKVFCQGGADNVFFSAGINLPTFIYGGEGDDSIKGGRGNDYIDGGNGKDTIYASDGNDIVNGMGGDDKIYGGLGDDKIYGGRGNDYIDGEQGHDFLLGNGTPNDGTTFSDNDIVRGGEGNDLIDGMGGNDKVYGDHGIDEVHGGDGDDSVYGGADDDRLMGGNGNDVLVSIGGGVGDRLWGEGGRDSFWLDDARTTELAMDPDGVESGGSGVHYVNQFENNVIYSNGVLKQERPSKELYGQDLMDPLAPFPYTYKDFSNRPLFNQFGPRGDDAVQGAVGDCYFIAGLNSIARTNQFRIREAVVDLGDGTYAVRFARQGVAKYYRVDNDLPTYNGKPIYAALGYQDAMWAAIMEKAFAYHKFFDGGQYEQLSGGRSEEPFAAIAAPWSEFWGTSGADLFNKIKAQLNLGKAVVASTVPDSPLDGVSFIEKHQYVVTDVNFATNRIYMRNPWGYDGTSVSRDTNPFDGYVSFTPNEFYLWFRNVTTAKV